MSRWIERILRPLALVAMVLLALTGIVVGATVGGDWRDLGVGTLAYYLVSLLAGLALLAPVALALRSPGAIRKASLAGLALALTLAGNQVLGLYLKTILCTTPT